MGKTSALRGKHDLACSYYDQVLEHYENDYSTTDDNAAHQAQVHMLYSEARIRLGDFGAAQDREESQKGAQQHCQKAIQILKDLSEKISGLKN